MRNLVAIAVALAMVTTASAATFTASFMTPAGTTVGQGESLEIHVHGLLDSSVDNDGLVFVSVDITAAGPADLDMGTAVAWGAGPGMDNFVQPAGYDANYGGTPVGLDLLQSGGAQNTIGNDPNSAPNLPFPAAEFIDFGVAHTEVMVLVGNVTIPEGQMPGLYTLSLENVLANVLSPGQTPVSFGVYSVEAAGSAGDSVVIEVMENSCQTPDFRPGVQGASAGGRMFDGFIDARRESANGVDIIGMDSITVQFTTPMQNNDGSPLSASAFSIVDTAGTAPSITGITTADDQTVTVNLSGHITLQEWTTLSVSARSSCAADPFNGGIDIGYLPADVNQNGNVNPLDLLKFKQYVNGISLPPMGVIEDYIDTNRSGGVNPLDLLAFKQLINGVMPPATQSWNGATLPAQP